MISLGDIDIDSQKLSYISDSDMKCSQEEIPTTVPRLPSGCVHIAIVDDARGRDVIHCNGLGDIQTVYRRLRSHELHSVAVYRVNLSDLPLSIDIR